MTLCLEDCIDEAGFTVQPYSGFRTLRLTFHSRFIKKIKPVCVTPPHGPTPPPNLGRRGSPFPYCSLLDQLDQESIHNGPFSYYCKRVNGPTSQ